MGMGINNIHEDKALTNMSINYDPLKGGLVGEAVSRVVNVTNESDKYWAWDKSSTFRIPTDYRADGAPANELDFDASSSTYSCEEYAYQIAVTDRQKANADSVLQLRKNKMMRADALLRLAREKAIATALTTSGNYDATNYTTLSSTTQWNNSSFSGSIEANLDTGKEAIRADIGVYPNIIVIPAAVAMVIKRNAEIRELIKYTQSGLLVNDDLPPTMFGMKVFIPGAINVTTQEGAAAHTYADIWGKHVVMLYQGASALDEPNAFTLFRSCNWKVDTWREEERSREVLRVSVVQDEVFTVPDAAYLIVDAIS